MDYGVGYGVVFTPEQLNHIHYALETTMTEYLSTSFRREEAIIPYPITERHNSFIARKVKVEGGSPIRLQEGESLFVNCEEFEPGSEIDIPKGAVFTVNLAGYQYNLY